MTTFGVMEGKNPSLWIATKPGRRFGSLRASKRRPYDVVVVGGGISGITAAALLVRAGKRVALVEMHRVAQGVTGGTTAHLTEVLDSRFHVLRSNFGDDGARLARESHRTAVDRIESFVKELGIECGFRSCDGYLYSEHDDDHDELAKEQEACAAVGLHCKMLHSIPLPFGVSAALRFTDQATFHPREYLLALLAHARAEGLEVFEDTRVEGLEDGDPVKIETTRGTLRAKDVLVTTDAPMATRVLLHTKIAHYRSYVIAAPTKRGVADALFWDMEDPYHYVRVHEVNGRQILIVGGEDHKVGQQEEIAASAWERLEEWTRARFDVGDVRWKWSAQVIEPVDGLSFVGRSPMSEHLYLSTGHSGNGMTGGTMSAMLLADIVLGRDNPWAALYDATRMKPLASAVKFVTENVDFPAHLLADRVRRSEVSSVEEIPRGKGALVNIGMSTLAVSRDDAGALHALDAQCTHLYCHVKWNTAEKTWDCPCHGSRFDAAGDVIHGPAISPLEKRELPPEDEARP